MNESSGELLFRRLKELGIGHVFGLLGAAVLTHGVGALSAVKVIAGSYSERVLLLIGSTKNAIDLRLCFYGMNNIKQINRQWVKMPAQVYLRRLPYLLEEDLKET